MALSKAEAQRLACHCFAAKTIGPPSEVATLARLWGGMGHVYRVRWDKEQETMIVKWVNLQNADPNDRGDRRKLESYTVEVNFYRCFSADLQTKHSVAIPTFLYAEHDADQHNVILCLSALAPPTGATRHRGVLDWLARFHAATWHWDSAGKQEGQAAVQRCGTYWHLDTRPDEWADMRKHGWVGRLRRAARPIHTFLHTKQSTELRSWVHGDAKEANVLQMTQEKGSCISMCDFQYVGPGCPLQDVCYFLCSSGVAEVTSLVDYYYEKLNSYLLDNENERNSSINRSEFDFVLEVCYCDYMRFMCGWGQWGSDITQRVVAWLDLVDGGQILDSEEAYDQAIQVAFEKAESESSK